ncbi:metallophosphoesterase [Calothrix sp. CCY 0018]|uniref:metallophosphoesterase n=1 Tax=Calothrix sp. CCY 0018 TaxID=3103864 RepID=UPI0039C651BA
MARRSLKASQKGIAIVKQAISRRGLTQQYLAEGSMLTRVTVSKFIHGKPVNTFAFKQICQQLYLNWEEIADLSDIDQVDVNVGSGLGANIDTVPTLSHVLHISDLHFGTTDNARTWYAKLAEDLRYESSCSRLDAVIISGDIASQSNPDEYAAAQLFINRLSQEFQLEPHQIVIVPGNHDINWKISETAYFRITIENSQQETEEHLTDERGKFIRGKNPEQHKQRFINFSRFYEAIKGELYPLDYEQQYTLQHLPEQKLLMLGLNSAWQIDHIDKHNASINSEALSNALSLIRQNPTYENCLKVAVWHHSLNSTFGDRITDSGVMERLTAAGFRFILHGSVHRADNSSYHYDYRVDGKQIDIIGVGVFGISQEQQLSYYPWQYNLLKIEENKLTIETRKRDEVNGVWIPDTRWRQDSTEQLVSHHVIVLNQNYANATKLNFNNSNTFKENEETDLIIPNPFIPRSGIVKTSQKFFGREKELNRIFEILNSGSSVALIGAREIGKSSLLWAISQQAETKLIPSRKAIYLDMSQVYDEEDFYFALCSEIGIEDCKGIRLTKALQKQRPQLLLLLDEIEKMTWDGFRNQVRGQLRGLANGHDAPLRLVVAASTSLDQLFPDSNEIGMVSPFQNICLEEQINLWDEATARDFISSRLASTPIRFTNEEVTEIVTASGGHPKELMQLCYQTYARYLQNKEKSFKKDSVETLVSHYVLLHKSQDQAYVGEELEVSLSQNSVTNGNNAGLIQISQNEATGNELNIFLTAPGFHFNNDNTTSLPLDPDTANITQTANFKLTALRPGKTKIQAELYVGETYKTTLETEVEVNAFEETQLRPLVAARSRPVPQPSFILQVRTTWNADISACVFNYHIDSYQSRLLFADNFDCASQSLSAIWVERIQQLLKATLEDTASSQPGDFRSRLVSFGKYLFESLFPEELQSTFRTIANLNYPFTLLIIADQDAWFPWELLHDENWELLDDGKEFLGDRLIIGRWLWELEKARPYEFPVGAVNVAHYANVEQPELWNQLLYSSGAPPPIPMQAGIFNDMSLFESIRGLHLIRYGQSADAENRQDAPVRIDNDNDIGEIEREVQPAKLSLRRNHPLVSLSYINAGQMELTALEQTWASTFVRAGCSAFLGSLWAVQPDVEAAFISAFYNSIWSGQTLAVAFNTARRLAKAVVPESLDWLAYVLFGDPMARPYRPVPGQGYAVVEPIGQEIDDPVAPGTTVRFRVSLRRTPPVWYENRLMEVAEDLTFDDLRVFIVTSGLQVTPGDSIIMTPTATGDYLGWFMLTVPPKIETRSVLVQVYFEDGIEPVHSLRFSLKIGNGEVEGI